MKFNVTGHLGYEVDGPATIISSLHCLQTPEQKVTDDTYIVLAVGRDYTDVAPVSGSYYGGGTSSLIVNVAVGKVK